MKGFIEQTDINGNGSDCPDARRRSMGALMMVTMIPFFRSADELQELIVIASKMDMFNLNYAQEYAIL